MIMPRYLISILDTGESFECDDETSILKAMVTIGRKGIPSGCHGGGCGICKVKIAEGDYHCGVMSRTHVTVEEQTDGYALSCRVFPRSAISVEVIGLMRRNFLRSVDI
ncbi:2Fe-2S iron-sulfur cluster-binding protein [Hyphococcus sp.]|uniref:2Fe-2S iron-sulfur cluster-binding protein n=1 Tax=Hyphococcus sp. TaxID=2038636 RepID=UPI0035C6DAD7